jgi:ribonuclease Z
LDFKILGTGSATPQLERNPSAFVVGLDNFSLLIDCGEGTQFQFLKYKIKSSRLKYILISHLHGDHYFGLIGLISSFNLNKRSDSLTIFGPPGLDELITLQLKLSNTQLNFKINFFATNPASPELIYDNDVFSIHTFPLKHRIPCVGIKITQKESKRKIITEKIPSDFPISFFKLLKDGFDVKDELTGKIYKNSEYTTLGQPPKSIAYCSDTIFDTSIVEHIFQVNLLYHEATFSEDNTLRATQTFHSTAIQAATIASKAKVDQLIIGHYSSRYKTISHFLEEAKTVFSATVLAEEGDSYLI